MEKELKEQIENYRTELTKKLISIITKNGDGVCDDNGNPKQHLIGLDLMEDIEIMYRDNFQDADKPTTNVVCTLMYNKISNSYHLNVELCFYGRGCAYPFNLSLEEYERFVEKVEEQFECS